MEKSDVRFYQQKVIKSGRFVEIYEYEEPQVILEGNADKQEKSAMDIGFVNIDVLRDRQNEVSKRAKKNFRRLIEANAGLHKTTDKFLTLTFAENVTDRTFAVKEFSKFIYKLRRKYGEFEYIAVTEYQERGAIHFHCVLFNFPYIPVEELPQLQKVWGLGYIDLKAIKDTFRLTNYLSKYFTKTFEENKNPKEKRFFRSLGLRVPEEAKTMSVTDIDALGLSVFESVYHLQYVGNVRYKKIRLFDKSKNLPLKKVLEKGTVQYESV